MSHSTVASRYADALFELALSRGCLETVDADLAGIARLIGEHADLQLLLESPVVALGDQKETIRRLFEGKVDPLTFNTLLLMLDNQRGGALLALHEGFRERYNRHHKRVKVEVTSALPLEEREQRDLSRALAKTTSREIEMEVTVDEGLIGGLVVKIGDQVIDNSIRGQLEALARTLA